VPRSSFLNYGKSSEKQIEQQKARKSRYYTEESQNSNLRNSQRISCYIEKDVIVEEMDDQLSGNNVTSEPRGSEISKNIYRGASSV
jgi:hypothetical protein